MLVVAVEVATDGLEGSSTVTGYSAELLVPKWFSKDPSTSIEEDNNALIASTRRAFERIRGDAQPGATAFTHWLRAQNACVESASPETPRLVAMLGVALIERALIDAVCRAGQTSLQGALQDDLLGVRFGQIERRLGDWTPADLGKPSQSVRLRHTVGLVDALDAGEIQAGACQGDDHPLSLVDDIAAYGLDCFKLKVSGNEIADVDRLERISSLTPEGSSFTLDGNEQYQDPGALADVLDDLERRGHADRILGGLLAIEQPVARARTFDAQASEGLARLSARAPVIIDEADADLSSYPRAKALGYGGVSMKACKGVFRALLNRARIDADGDGLQSAEDLTNLPVLPLHQDLAVVASLGLPHVERNGHHYFRGQSYLSSAESDDLVQHHSSLYHRTESGETLLTIEAGRLDLSSILHRGERQDLVQGFGYAGPIDMERGTPLTR